MTPGSAYSAAGRLAERADAATGLELLARAVASSVRIGRHVSLGAGAGDEFYDYRPADADTPAETIDWRASARRETPVVRRRRHQARMTLVVVLDASASMGFRAIRPARSTPSKIDDARVIAGSLVALAARQGDRCQIIIAHGDDITITPALSPTEALPRAFAAMLDATPSGRRGLIAGLDAIASLARDADVIAAVSDALEPAEEIAAAIERACRRAGPSRDLLLAQVLARDEIAPPPRAARLVDPETGRARQTPRSRDLGFVAGHVARVREIVLAARGRHALHETGAATDATLRRLLGDARSGAQRLSRV